MAIKISLDREWRFRIHDPEEEKQYRHPTAIDFYAVKAGYADGFGAWAVDDSDWRMLDVPHDACVEAPFTDRDCTYHGAHERNSCWYRKTFSLDPSLRGKQLLVVFDGIAVNGKIYFNGSLVKSHFSPYGEVVIDITDRANFNARGNVLAVFIDGSAYEGWFYEGIGIYRHVWLYVKEQLHIAHDGAFLKPVRVDETNWRLDAVITVENSGYETLRGEISLALDEIGDDPVWQSVEVDAGVRCDVHLSMIVKSPELWDIDHPRLYRTQLLLTNDEVVQDYLCDFVGFREFHFDADKGFLLNGRQIKIKGMCNHQDHAGVGTAVPETVQEYRIRRLREMGCNAYRSAHNPPSRELLAICDRLGMLVMSELRRFEVSEENRQLLESMIRSGRNHPSVILWSVFNEEPLQEKEEGRRMFARLRQWIKKLDPTRPVLGAMHRGWNLPESCALDMEVTGLSYNFDKLPEFHARYPEQPIVGSEHNSVTSTRGCFESSTEKHEITSYKTTGPATDLMQLWKFTRENDWMSGFFTWTGFDYRGEPTPFGYPSVSSQYGCIDTCGFGKTNYYIGQACFLEKPVLHIAPHWNHEVGETVPVRVITNSEEAELFLNGISLGRQKTDACELTEWMVPYEAGELSAIGYRRGKEIVQESVFTAGKPATLKLETAARGSDAIVVNVSAVDEAGYFCPLADHMVHFDTNGTILGVGNGNPNSLEPDKADSRRLYYGRCQVIIRPNSDNMPLYLRAWADGLQSDFSDFYVEAPEAIEALAETNQHMLSFRMSDKIFEDVPDITRLDIPEYIGSLKPLVLNPNRFQPFGGGWRLYQCRLPFHPDCQYETGMVTFEEMSAERLIAMVDGNIIYNAKPGYRTTLTFSESVTDRSVLSLLIFSNAATAGIKGFVYISAL